jgi:hypothetical protein
MNMTPLEDKTNALHHLTLQLVHDAWAHARYDGHPDTVAAIDRRVRELDKALDEFKAMRARMAPQEVRV